MTEVQQKFIDLLKEMFQFDQADLDFGIYRIMNAKHDEIEKFLEKNLPAEIDEGLKAIKNPASAEQIKKLEEDLAKAKEWNLKDKIEEIENQLKMIKSNSDSSAAENDIYNQLLDFFSRYYDEGDFISQRRYSKGKYAIPYEGEEVKLHWANADQYYIKTSEYFKDYTFSDGFGNKVHFKILDAETEQNNNKSKDKKFFQLTEQEKKFEIIDGELFIYVEYRIGTQKTQKPYIQEIIDAFTTYSNENANEYQKFISLTVKERGQDTSLLEKQLINYTAKNNFDYFIHKDLRGFLTQELDFYIKNEVIRLDDIDETDEAKTKLILTKAKVLRTIAKKIIAFLAQLEDFQKKLFLKKKFVTETNYCITLDRIDESFYKEIAANDEQRKEWVKLFAIDEIKATAGDLLSEGKCGYSEPLTEQFLKENPYLVLDTAFFSSDFKEKLVSNIDDFDNKLDGLLIHSENFQALNLLQERYKHSIKSIYIDPPYNAKSSEIMYKNNYKDSSWLALMNDRVQLAKNLFKDNTVFVTAIDEVENFNLGLLYNNIFSNYVDACISIVHNPTGQQGDNFSYTHEFAHFIYPNGLNCIGLEDRDDPLRESEPDIRPLRNVSSGKNHYRESAANCFYPIYVKNGEIIGFGDVSDDNYHPEGINVQNADGSISIYPIDPSGDESKWCWARDTVETIRNELTAEYNSKKGTWDIIRRKARFRYNSLWKDKRYSANSYGSVILNSMFTDEVFSYPKSIYNVQDCVDASLTNENTGIVLDFFAGSGTTAHAVINLNRNEKTKGSRKYILCEMGNYFDTVTKPRVQKVIYSKDWKDGKPVSREGSSHAFKYIRLESYEDTLNNITLNSAGDNLLDSAQKDYFLNYMMDFESKESDSLLNIEKLAHPFDYTMKITRAQECKEHKIDLVETFNYLIGLTVTSNGALQGYDATFSTDTTKPLTATIKTGSSYRIKMIEGTNRTGERVLVIWRDLTGDIEKDNAVLDAFFAKKHVNPLDFEYKTIYVNGDNNLQNIKTEDENWKVILIESEMKKRMFSEQ